MLKKILLALMFVITAITNVTHAEDDMKTVASKAYVDTMIETKQLKIPAAGQPNVGAGETVMTYTSTGNGEIGERGLYSDISSYDASTDGDKLITASALNATFTNLPTTPTTKLECANQADGCTLWTIVDQTAYRKSRNLFNKNNPSEQFDGYLNTSTVGDTGILNVYDGGDKTLFVPVEPNTTYTITRNNIPSGVYNRFKAISFATNSYPGVGSRGVVLENHGDITTKSMTVTTLNDTTYLGVQVRNSGQVGNDWQTFLDGFQVEQGPTATPYEPY